jgi:hypothetical protein
MVRADEKLSIAKALPKERRPVTQPSHCVYLLATVPDPVIYEVFSFALHHRIVSDDNEFTVEWRRRFCWNKRS